MRNPIHKREKETFPSITGKNRSNGLCQESKKPRGIPKIPNTTKEQMEEIDIIISIITLCVNSPSSTVEKHRQTEVNIKGKSKYSIRVKEWEEHPQNMELGSRRV